jgi:hypothetical protein
MINGVVLGGFEGHCDLFNYTGMIVGVSTTPGVGMLSILTFPNTELTHVSGVTMPKEWARSREW